MKDIALRRYLLTMSSAAALLAGCGELQPMIGAPGAMPQSRAIAMHVERGGSWMLPEASGENLLYVTNLTGVSVYSYPQGNLMGFLDDPAYPGSDCSDAQGDVYIADGSSVFEYAHGGSKPLRILSDPAGAASCAIDPTTGDLATAGGIGSSYGGVEIYTNARGSPTHYSDPEFRFYDFCAYDNKGNLFVDGTSVHHHRFILAKLPKRSDALQMMKLDQYIRWPGSVQWDDLHLAVGAFSTPIIYRFKIAGTDATEIGKTQLGAPARHIYAFVTQEKTLVAVGEWSHHRSPYTALFFKYPDGGSPTRSITKDLDSPRGAAVSLAPSR